MEVILSHNGVSVRCAMFEAILGFPGTLGASLPDDLVEDLGREDRALCRQPYKEGHVRPLVAGAVKIAARCS